MLLNASGRADDDMRAVLQRADLRADGNPAAQRENLDVVSRTRQAAQFLGDLISQFAGRAKHQRLAAEIAWIERLEQRDAERGGFAAAGLCLRDEVHALEHHGQALGLNRRHFGVAERVEIGQRRGAERQGGEG